MDFILGNGEVALEIKGSGNIQNRDMRALKTFSQDYSPRLSIIVCNEREERRRGDIKREGRRRWPTYLRRKRPGSRL